MDAGGLDSDGHGFRNSKEMWREEIGLGEGQEEDATSAAAAKRHGWYQKGISYWQGVDASVDGVLGGYGHVNETDVKGSEGFLKPLLLNRFGSGRRHLVALDCGSGIGRITKNLLLRHFNEVDLLEPVPHFLGAARENLAPEGDVQEDVHITVNFYCLPLQEFTPEAGRYDVIWIQWCIGHLPDDDFVSFFKRAKIWRNRLAMTHDRTATMPTVVAATVLANSAHEFDPITRYWDTSAPSGDTTHFAWCPPPKGWIKINFDGSIRQSGISGCTYVIRNDRGELVEACGKPMRHWDTQMVELECLKLFEKQVIPDLLSTGGIIIEGDIV